MRRIRFNWLMGLLLFLLFALRFPLFAQERGTWITINRNSAFLLHTVVPPSSLVAVQNLNLDCEIARDQYAKGEYQSAVDTLFIGWTEAPVGVSRLTKCRAAVAELAASLRKLGRSEDEIRVYRRLIEINPGARDWVMHFAALETGEVETQNKNWSDALKFYVLAYDSAIQVPPEIELAYEERAWRAFVTMFDRLVEQNLLKEAISVPDNKNANALNSPGWYVWDGILNEKQCQLDNSLQSFHRALQMAPQATYLLRHIQSLEEIPPPCSGPGISPD